MGFSHVGTTGSELLANFLVITSWCLSYRLGASVELQLYIVITLGLLVTFGFYAWARSQQRRETKTYKVMTRIGKWTHVGHTPWFERFRDFLDRGC